MKIGLPLSLTVTLSDPEASGEWLFKYHSDDYILTERNWVKMIKIRQFIHVKD
jgi:hypothetical protein